MSNTVSTPAIAFQPRTQGLSLGKTLASAGHVTLIKICSRGRVGECRIYNCFTTPCCRIRSPVPFVLKFAKLNSLYSSEVILKPFFCGKIFLAYDKSLIFCLIPAWIFAKKERNQSARSILSIVSFCR